MSRDSAAGPRDASAATAAARAFVDAHRADTEALLRDLVAIDSTTGRETALAEFCARWLRDHGVGAELQPCRGRFNVVGVAGRGPAALVLSGHLDTVPANAGRWSSPPLEPRVHDGRLYGLGASDIKASIAAAYVASWYLSTTGLAARCITAMTVEEETTGEGTREYVARAVAEGALDPARTAAIVTEPTGLEHVSLGSRGAIFADVSIRGLGGHGSRPHLARNPARAAARMIAAVDELVAGWRERFADPRFPAVTATVTSLRGGDPSRHNVIPQEAGFVLDCRPTPALGADGFADLKRELLAALRGAAGDGIELDVDWRYPRPGHEIAADAPIVRIARESLREDLGVEAELLYTPAGNDACHFGRNGIPAVNKLGPGHAEQAHRVDEYVTLENVHRAAVLFARIAERFADAAS